MKSPTQKGYLKLLIMKLIIFLLMVERWIVIPAASLMLILTGKNDVGDTKHENHGTSDELKRRCFLTDEFCDSLPKANQHDGFECIWKHYNNKLVSCRQHDCSMTASGALVYDEDRCKDSCPGYYKICVLSHNRSTPAEQNWPSEEHTTLKTVDCHSAVTRPCCVDNSSSDSLMPNTSHELSQCELTDDFCKHLNESDVSKYQGFGCVWNTGDQKAHSCSQHECLKRRSGAYLRHGGFPCQKECPLFYARCSSIQDSKSAVPVVTNSSVRVPYFTSTVVTSTITKHEGNEVSTSSVTPLEWHKIVIAVVSVFVLVIAAAAYKCYHSQRQRSREYRPPPNQWEAEPSSPRDMTPPSTSSSCVPLTVMVGSSAPTYETHAI